MDFKQLAKVTDSIQNGGKQKVTAEGRPVVDEKNPLDALDEREHIADTAKSKVIIIDSEFIKKLAKAPRETRRKFMSRIPDSHRRKVLSLMKQIKDAQGNKLGYILLDDLLANIITDPSKENQDNLADFIKTQSYIAFSDKINKLIEQVKAGEVSLDQEAIAEIEAGMEGRPSRIKALQAEVEDSAEETAFELPDEVDLSEEDINTIGDAARSHVATFKEHMNVREVIDACEDLLADMQGKNHSYGKSAEVYWAAFDAAWKEQFPDGTSFTTKTEAQEIKDSIEEMQQMIEDASAFDTIEEGPAIDNNGKEVKNVEETPVLDLLVEALEAFQGGDDEKLTALSQHTLSVEEDGSPQIEELVEEDEISFKDEDEEAELNDSVTHLARRILGGKSVNKLADALTKKEPRLGKFNLKINDCVAPFCELPEECQAVNPPLTRAEYYQLCPPVVDPLMAEMLEQCSSPQILSYTESVPEGNLLNVNQGQLYYPYSCSAEELQQRIEQASEDETVQQIISSCAVPLRDAMRIAATCDALPFIDSRFYKTCLNDHCWTFDPECIPACMEGAPEGNHVERCRAAEANFFIFGVPFHVY